MEQMLDLLKINRQVQPIKVNTVYRIETLISMSRAQHPAQLACPQFLSS